jgi:cytochrome bd-type quinol oxidase subunit 2
VAVEFSATARRLGILSAVGVVVLGMAYAITLAVGFLSLNSPQQPIGDPMFSILEVLIIVMMPMMVALMVAVHAWAPSHAKALSLTAVVFMGLLAGVTCSLHFVILTLSRPSGVRQPVMATTVPIVQVALGRVRSRHPGLGLLLRALDVFRGSGS